MKRATTLRKRTRTGRNDREGIGARAHAVVARSVVVAYSGGVDSAYLACVAGRTLGNRAWAITADSASHPERHRAIAIQIAERFGSS